MLRLFLVDFLKGIAFVVVEFGKEKVNNRIFAIDENEKKCYRNLYDSRRTASSQPVRLSAITTP